MHRSSRLIPIAIMALSIVAPTSLRGQDAGDAPWFAGFPAWTVEFHAGLANQGRFLLQAIDDDFDPIVRQRRLSAANGFSWGAAVGVTVLPLGQLRLTFTRTSTDLDFEDDTGTGTDVLDDDDVAGLSSSVLGLEVRRYLFGPRVMFTPYGGLGIALAWWNLDERGVIPTIVSGDDDSELRFAASATFGIRYRPTPNWAVSLEVADFEIGNPFTGDDSFIPVTGFTIDEPTTVRQTHFRIVGSYTFDSN